jgi:methionine sulfoxide reductase heme-binding subunit
MNSFLSNKWLKVPVFLACVVPVALLAWGITHNGYIQSIDRGPSTLVDLGADPVAYITHSTGDWTIRFLLITLAITPLRKLLSMPALIRYRRMLGLFAFFYGCLHLTTYLWLYQSFDFHAIWADVWKRRFITVGFLGFVLMIPLAITSTKGWIRRMGGKNWTWLHRLIYLSAIAGVIHYAWLVKSDETRPLQYAVILGILLLYRIVASFIGNKKPPAVRAARPEPVTSESA